TLGRRTGLNVAAHLTCVDASRAETLDIAARYHEAGVSHLVALRGDPPQNQGGFAPHADGFANSVDLVEALAKTGNFDITVGAYPDPHPEAASDDADITWLKRKIDAGATRAITQFFFEADTFFRFRDRAVKAGITAPILPGILPIQSWAGTQKIAKRCGARIPGRLTRAFQTAERDDRTGLLAIAECTDLCSNLLEGGVEHLHFYTLNNPTLTRDVVHALGLVPDPALEKVA
ncbi:methylenetetrahydrofolate reductase, partial [Rhodobacteraceae bacterium]|nr:methylenetetrahydrofolate reductase [Paracoccaceae bacterium]